MNTVHPFFAGIDYCRYYDSMLNRFVLYVQAEVIAWLLQTIVKSASFAICLKHRYLHTGISKSITLLTFYDDARQHGFWRICSFLRL